MSCKPPHGFFPQALTQSFKLGGEILRGDLGKNSFEIKKVLFQLRIGRSHRRKRICDKFVLTDALDELYHLTSVVTGIQCFDDLMRGAEIAQAALSADQRHSKLTIVEALLTGVAYLANDFGQKARFGFR